VAALTSKAARQDRTLSCGKTAKMGPGEQFAQASWGCTPELKAQPIETGISKILRLLEIMETFLSRVK